MIDTFTYFWNGSQCSCISFLSFKLSFNIFCDHVHLTVVQFQLTIVYLRFQILNCKSTVCDGKIVVSHWNDPSLDIKIITLVRFAFFLFRLVFLTWNKCAFFSIVFKVCFFINFNLYRYYPKLLGYHTFDIHTYYSGSWKHMEYLYLS